MIDFKFSLEWKYQCVYQAALLQMPEWSNNAHHLVVKKNKLLLALQDGICYIQRNIIGV